ncbi:hypothetical protein TYRP_023683 [Tyrophagus putrescentiae]|nr:hypothetical protein TYRP_023683 [Tyrophagus putrescentiae]
MSELAARGPVQLQIEVAGTKVTHPTYLANIEEPIVGAYFRTAPSGTANTSNISVHLGQLITATETTSVHALDRRLINCLAIEASSISAAQHISSGDTSTFHAVNAVPSNLNTSLASRYTLPLPIKASQPQKPILPLCLFNGVTLDDQLDLVGLTADQRSSTIVIINKHAKTDEQQTSYEIVSTSYGENVTLYDLSILDGIAYLENDHIDGYLQLVVNKHNKEQNFFINRLPSNIFWSLNKTDKYRSIAENYKFEEIVFGKILVSINLNSVHWTLIVVDNYERKFTYYDSLYDKNKNYYSKE